MVGLAGELEQMRSESRANIRENFLQVFKNSCADGFSPISYDENQMNLQVVNAVRTF